MVKGMVTALFLLTAVMCPDGGGGYSQELSHLLTF